MEAARLFTDSLINLKKKIFESIRLLPDLVFVIQGFPFNYHIFQINKYVKFHEFVST